MGRVHAARTPRLVLAPVRLPLALPPPPWRAPPRRARGAARRAHQAWPWRPGPGPSLPSAVAPTPPQVWAWPPASASSRPGHGVSALAWPRCLVKARSATCARLSPGAARSRRIRGVSHALLLAWCARRLGAVRRAPGTTCSAPPRLWHTHLPPRRARLPLDVQSTPHVFYVHETCCLFYVVDLYLKLTTLIISRS
jgi:hypothetical protein